MGTGRHFRAGKQHLMPEGKYLRQHRMCVTGLAQYGRAPALLNLGYVLIDPKC